MSTKMKGLLKGLRYISQIFDEEEEAELQIGFPTDVKHVAHIGWDGPTTNAPTWINQFKNEGDSTTAPSNDLQNAQKNQEKRFSTGSDSLPGTPLRHRPAKSKSSRRHSSAGSSGDSPRRSSASEGRTKLDMGSSESTSNPKTTRKKKAKGSSSGTSSSKTSSKSKPTIISAETTPYSDHETGGGQNMCEKSKDTCQSSVLKENEEDQKALDDISRGIHAL